MSYKIRKYPDGTTYVDVNYTELPEEIVFRANSYEELWQLGQLVDAYVNMYGEKPVIVLPNLLDAQADRRFAKGQSTGLKLVCNFLNTLPVKKYCIFHPHNPEAVEALLNDVEIINNSGFINEVLSRLVESTQSINNLILMSSDAGGFKPLMKLCDHIGWIGETFSAAKSRSWDEVDGTKFIQQVNKDDFGGKDILIVDDICVFGGTFKGLAKMLKDRNVGKLYLAVSHMTVDIHKSSELFDLFDKVFTTNSKYSNYFYPVKDGGKQADNLEVIEMF